MSYLEFKADDAQVIIKGRTFDAKESIKKFGGQWNPEMRAWIIPSANPKEDVTTLSGKIKFHVNEERVKSAIAENDSKYSWICCEKACVHDWGKKISNCPTHDFRVCGRRYTGD